MNLIRAIDTGLRAFMAAFKRARFDQRQQAKYRNAPF